MEGTGRQDLDKESIFWPAEVQIGEVVYPPGGSLGPRRQINLQLVLLHSGSATVWIDGMKHVAATNTVFVLFPNHEERFAFAKDCATHHSWVHASVPRLHHLLVARLQRLLWPLPLSPSMNQLMQDALSLRTTTFPTREELLKTLVVQMIWRYIGEGEQRLDAQARPIHHTVEQTLHYIQQHLQEPLTLEVIADAAAVSPTHLIRLFQHSLHTTPMHYVWRRRVNKGIEYLEQTGLPVGIIAERCGFQSRYHFSRKVRQATGYTPLEIRQRSWQRRL